MMLCSLGLVGVHWSSFFLLEFLPKIISFWRGAHPILPSALFTPPLVVPSASLSHFPRLSQVTLGSARDPPVFLFPIPLLYPLLAANVASSPATHPDEPERLLSAIDSACLFLFSSLFLAGDHAWGRSHIDFFVIGSDQKFPLTDTSFTRLFPILPPSLFSSFTR